MPDTRLFPLEGGVRRSPDVEAWLSAQPPRLQKIARRWFNEMRSAGPDVLELLHDGHPTACVENLAFAYVNAFREHVNVGFFLGSSLEDRTKLLLGTGRFMRHVKLRPHEVQDEEGLSQLIVSAYKDMKARLGGS